eukprot:1980277-Prymnesium_polylepis.1
MYRAGRARGAWRLARPVSEHELGAAYVARRGRRGGSKAVEPAHRPVTLKPGRAPARSGRQTALAVACPARRQLVVEDERVPARQRDVDGRLVIRAQREEPCGAALKSFSGGEGDQQRVRRGVPLLRRAAVIVVALDDERVGLVVVRREKGARSVAGDTPIGVDPTHLAASMEGRVRKERTASSITIVDGERGENRE